MALGITKGNTQKEKTPSWLDDITDWSKKDLHISTELLKIRDQRRQMAKDAIETYGQ